MEETLVVSQVRDSDVRTRSRSGKGKTGGPSWKFSECHCEAYAQGVVRE